MKSRETKIDAKTNSLPIWIDITGLITTGNFKVKDTTLVFHFWSDLYKEPLLTINADNDSTPISAVYKWFPINAPTIEVASNTSIEVYPNPTKEAIDVRLDGLATENCHLQIVDGFGRIVFNQKIEANKVDELLHINTSQWASGVYFLALLTETDRGVFITKTFVVER